MVYDCKCNGWQTEKECKLCFEQNKKHQYGHVKHCRKDNVTAIESDNYRDME